MATTDVEVVSALLGRPIADAEAVRVARLLDIAESLIEDGMPGFSFQVGETTDTFDVWDIGSIWTSKYPVSVLRDLRLDNGVIAVGNPPAYTVTEKGHVEFCGWWDRCWPHRRVKVEISYAYGLDPVPMSLAGTVAAAVADLVTRQDSETVGLLSRSETMGAYSYSDQYGAARAALANMLLPDIEQVKRRWSRTVQVSVPMVTR